MDPERIRFLFGDDADIDPADLDGQPLLLDELLPVAPDGAPDAMHREVASQILDDDPPEAWAAAQRLLAAGHDRTEVRRQLSLAFVPFLIDALRSGEFEKSRYADALALLPLPDLDEATAAIVDIVRASPGIDAPAAVAGALARLDRDAEDRPAETMLERIVDQLVDADGPLDMSPPDRLAHIGDLIDDIVLTHRVTEAEVVDGSVRLAFDLGPLIDSHHLRLDDGATVALGFDGDVLDWAGPDGWLDSFGAGTLLTLRIDSADRIVTIGVAETDPGDDPSLVERVHEAYQRIVDEPWLPVSGASLVIDLLLDDPATFASPTPPLAELAEAAGLEVRGGEAGHEESVWHNAVRAERTYRLRRLFRNDRDAALAVLLAVDVADLLAGMDPAAIPDIEGPVDDDLVRSVLGGLGDHELMEELEMLEVLAGELVVDLDGGAVLARNEGFVDALVRVARRPREQATAHLLAALLAERTGEPMVAEQHLNLARRGDPDSALIIERLAWYASDRGDAAAAVRLWRQVEPTGGISQYLDDVEPFTRSSGPAPGRNEPCWCGSGRKYKQCHLGEVATAPIEDRVGWLCRKAVMFLEHQGAEADNDVYTMAESRALDPDDPRSLGEAFGDPIVIDLVLTELGWFERFVQARGALLPDDEALAARAWTLVERTVYEVVDVRPGHALTVRDLRTGETVQVSERSFSRQAQPAMLVCARAVPAGDSHQFVGGVVPVPPGREAHLLDLIDDQDPWGIAEWVRDLHRPPRLTNREGEDSVGCELVIEVPDVAATRNFLDATYAAEDSPDGRPGGEAESGFESEAAVWTELFALNDDEDIVRASLRLDGTRLTVSTNSEARADRVLATVLQGLDGSRIVSDERTPMDLSSGTGVGSIPGLPGAIGGGSAGGRPAGSGALTPEQIAADPDLTAALDDMRSRMEERWCDEQIPALGGRTPRECVADPTRREEVVRLIASFEGFDAGGDFGPSMSFRPARLRELLGL